LPGAHAHPPITAPHCANTQGPSPASRSRPLYQPHASKQQLGTATAAYGPQTVDPMHPTMVPKLVAATKHPNWGPASGGGLRGHRLSLPTSRAAAVEPAMPDSLFHGLSSKPHDAYGLLPESRATSHVMACIFSCSALLVVCVW
jgi:hypothetical protein